MLYALNEIHSKKKKLALPVLSVGNKINDDKEMSTKEQEHRMISGFRR
jgi:hypothetical protein